MAFEADHNGAALSQECAIVLRRTDFEGLGWLTVRLAQAKTPLNSSRRTNGRR
jgi:hypothetical protein